MLEFSSASEMRAHYRGVLARTRNYVPPKPAAEPTKPKLPWWPPRIEPIFSARELALFAILREGPGGKVIPRTFPPILRIQTVVREYYGYSHDHLVGDSRKKPVTRARHIAIYLCHILTRHSQPRIGEHFSGRDHTTILHAIRRIERELKTDFLLQSEFNELKAALTE